MNAISAPKSPGLNRLEGLTLTATLQALPTYAAAALLLKLAGSTQIVSYPGGAVTFVVLTSFFHALILPWLAPKYPKFCPGQLRAAVLRRQPVLRGKGDALAHPADGLAATALQHGDAVAAGGGGAERVVKIVVRSPQRLESFGLQPW